MNKINGTPTSLYETTNNELFKQVFSHINRWNIIFYECDTIIKNENSIIWCNDCIEFVLEFNDYLSCCTLTMYNVEINRHLIFSIPVVYDSLTLNTNIVGTLRYFVP